MKSRSMIAWSAALATAALLASSTADASLFMMVGSRTIADNGPGDVAAPTGVIVDNGITPGFNVVIDTGTAPSANSLDLTSFFGMSTAAGTLVVKLTQTNLSLVNVTSWLTQFSGTLTGVGGSVRLQTYLDASNAAFGTGIALGNLTSTSSPFALNSMNAGVGSALYSITEVLTITAGGAGDTFSVESVLTPVAPAAIPEPGAITLIGLGVAGMAVVRRRKRPGD